MAPKRKKFWGSNPRFKVAKPLPRTENNRFQVLSDMEDDDSSAEEGEVSEEIINIPPIIVDIGHKFTDVIKILGSSSKYKRMSIGTKVMPNTLIDYNEAIKRLKKDDIKFFTHPVKDNKKFKLMLFGLPQLDLKTIFEEFKNTFNIEPASINEIQTSRSNPDDALYMLEFNRSQISKREVTKIKYFCGIVVHWRNPRRRARGPTQCSKCALYGHGSSNCFRKNACLGCGGPHDYSTCQLNKVSTEGPVIYKCFNCINNNLKNVNHRADDVNCPSRREYLEIRQRITRKQRPHKPSQLSETDAYFWDEDILLVNRNNEQSPNSRAHNSPPTNRRSEQLNSRSYDAPRNHELPSCSRAHNAGNKSSYAATAKSGQNKDNDDLSNDRLLEIFFDAVDALEKCKSKYDKLRVLGNMLKHVI